MEDTNEPNKAPSPSNDDSNIHLLRKQLYANRESAEVEKRVRDLQVPTPKKKQEDLLTDDEAKPDLVNVMESRNMKHRRWLMWGGIGVLVVAIFAVAVGSTLWYRQSQQVEQEDLGLSISAPSEFTAGDEIQYVVQYSNDSRVSWYDSEVIFTPPSGFRFTQSTPQSTQSGSNYVFSLGTLSPGQRGEVTISGHLIGEQQANVLARAELAISPENFDKARFQRSETVSTTIVAVPLDISIEAAANAADGERVVGIIRVRNTSNNPISGGLLRLQSIGGIQFVTEDETFSPGFSVIDSWWELPTIEPLQEVTRTVVLHVNGQAGERRTLEMEAIIKEGEALFIQRKINHVITVSASELTVDQTINDSTESQVITAEQLLRGVVKYKNTGTTGLKNVVVSVQFEGSGLDASNLKLTGGAYNPTNQTITWTSASIPELATVLPSQEGEIVYEFAVLPTDSFPTDESGKNQTLVVTASIDSPDLPKPNGQERRIISDRLALPIGTQLTLEADAFYDDGRLGLPSSGPVPPKVGEQTTYTLRFRSGSTFNDAGEVKMVAVLPDGIQYTDKTYKTTGDIEFNDRTQEITWTIPVVSGLSGRAAPAPELHVQVALTPGENLRNTVVELLQSATVEGLDLFTDERVTTSLTTFPTTETASPQNGTVQ